MAICLIWETIFSFFMFNNNVVFPWNNKTGFLRRKSKYPIKGCLSFTLLFYLSNSLYTIISVRWQKNLIFHWNSCRLEAIFLSFWDLCYWIVSWRLDLCFSSRTFFCVGCIWQDSIFCIIFCFISCSCPKGTLMGIKKS